MTIVWVCWLILHKKYSGRYSSLSVAGLSVCRIICSSCKCAVVTSVVPHPTTYINDLTWQSVFFCRSNYETIQDHKGKRYLRSVLIILFIYYIFVVLIF
jgi:hypothetical protein